MSDRYAQLLSTRAGGLLARRVGLPRPARLERHEPGAPVLRGRALVGGAPGGRLLEPVVEVLGEARCELATGPEERLRAIVARAGLDATIFDPEAAGEQRLKALVFDASAIATCGELSALHAFFHGCVGRVERCGRVIVLGSPPADCRSVAEHSAQRALEGFTRSLGKEIGRGATVQLVLVAAGARDAIASTLRFLLSPRSAYVSGQVLRLGPARPPARIDWEKPLAGRSALVTGASRGIGEAIATTLAREEARVIGLDVPALAADLRRVSARIGGEPLELDITAPEAPAAIAERVRGGLDVLVHNAGVTRDRTLAKMPRERWCELLEINLCSQERIDETLLEAELLGANGRIVCVSSMSGIAGNAGQTNYATSKAGVIGRVGALAPLLAERGATINAVAPGFIETQMTAAMPIAIREAGRRMSSLAQGGLPIDVAETIAWLAHPGSGALNGNVVRVCGQSFLGA
ncbi:MAG TPA: 3-oxoacyl-ACP reductase [Solirubrobacteraceae bacterium]|nr:3-oxoacyl-ACP reductase [Solirubrobacteraceae bacterium]